MITASPPTISAIAPAASQFMNASFYYSQVWGIEFSLMSLSSRKRTFQVAQKNTLECPFCANSGPPLTPPAKESCEAASPARLRANVPRLVRCLCIHCCQKITEFRIARVRPDKLNADTCKRSFFTPKTRHHGIYYLIGGPLRRLSNSFWDQHIIRFLACPDMRLGFKFKG
jgi:hypothetical protein